MFPVLRATGQLFCLSPAAYTPTHLTHRWPIFFFSSMSAPCHWLNFCLSQYSNYHISYANDMQMKAHLNVTTFHQIKSSNYPHLHNRVQRPSVKFSSLLNQQSNTLFSNFAPLTSINCVKTPFPVQILRLQSSVTWHFHLFKQQIHENSNKYFVNIEIHLKI